MSKALRETNSFRCLQPLEWAGHLAGAAAHHRLGAPGGGLARDRRLQRAGAGLGKGVACGRRLGPSSQHHLDHLGDDVAGALDHHRVADADVLPGDLVGVVKGGVLHHHPADVDRRQLGHRRQRAGSPDLDLDVVDDRARLLGRELVGDGPAGQAADEAQPLLPVQPVDLVDHPVDVEAEPSAARPPASR